MSMFQIIVTEADVLLTEMGGGRERGRKERKRRRGGRGKRRKRRKRRTRRRRKKMTKRKRKRSQICWARTMSGYLKNLNFFPLLVRLSYFIWFSISDFLVP